MSEQLEIYNQYVIHGVDKYYELYNSTYYNPHADKIKNIINTHLLNLIKKNNKILDIACGNGLITRIINNNNNIIIGCDPYFKNKYVNYNYSFEDIAKGLLNIKVDMAICCYAFHLLNKSWYYSFLNELALITNIFEVAYLKSTCRF